MSKLLVELCQRVFRDAKTKTYGSVIGQSAFQKLLETLEQFPLQRVYARREPMCATCCLLQAPIDLCLQLSIAAPNGKSDRSSFDLPFEFLFERSR